MPTPINKISTPAGLPGRLRFCDLGLGAVFQTATNQPPRVLVKIGKYRVTDLVYGGAYELDQAEQDVPVVQLRLLPSVARAGDLPTGAVFRTLVSDTALVAINQMVENEPELRKNAKAAPQIAVIAMNLNTGATERVGADIPVIPLECKVVFMADNTESYAHFNKHRLMPGTKTNEDY